MIIEKKYIARHVVYNFLGIKFKLKTEHEHIDTINLVLDEKYGIGNRIFAIINAIKFYTPKNLNIYWNNSGWVSESFKNLFEYDFEYNINEFGEISNKWNNSKNERTIYFPQASLITPDGAERTLANKNITPEVIDVYKNLFLKLRPSEKVKERIEKIKLPESYVALQIRNAADWNKYGRNESLDSFVNKIKEYPLKTVFYLSSMNKENSDYIKNKMDYKIIELDQKDYNSMYDAIADLYIMSCASEGIYSYGSTFGELAWWLSPSEQKYTIIGTGDNWKWIKTK